MLRRAEPGPKEWQKIAETLEATHTPQLHTQIAEPHTLYDDSLPPKSLTSAAATQQWEQTAAFRLEMAVKHGLARYYAKNDHLGLMIPCEYLGAEHNYLPDYLVRLSDDVTLLLEIKVQEDNHAKAKHDSARRWVSAVNNWGKLGAWDLHVCRNPQVLEKELGYILKTRENVTSKGNASAFR